MSGAHEVQNAVAQLKANREVAAPVEEITAEPVEVQVEEETIGDMIIPEAEVVDTEETPAIDAPNSWSKDDKEHFHSLPTDMQQRLANRERDRDLNIRKSQDDIATERKAITAELESASLAKANYLRKLKETQVQEPSSDMLDDLSDNYDPDAYHRQMAAFKKGNKERTDLENEVSLESATKTAAWQTQEIKVYENILPEFVDKTKGPAYRQKLADYLVEETGITMAQARAIFPTMPAKEMRIVVKAMKYDEAMSGLKAPKGKPKPKSLSGSSNNPPKIVKTDVKSAAASFGATRSPQAAAALLAAGRKAKG